ncbi:MAG: acyl-CoA thioesterase [Polaromonas sp. 28-63-22]|jgi:acyl-CoA thioesterase|nr:MAG: acyl-CoA thioesterase [Polaromonas sp. 28-63-22]
MNPLAMHPFDQAMRLEAAGGAQAGTWLGATSPAYGNMVGPFGGTTAATALQAILLHPDLLGQPVALTVNYAAALAAGPFRIAATPVRTNRSTQHWTVTLTQADPSGADSVAMTATAVTAVRRETWGGDELPMPDVTMDKALPRLMLSTPEWTRRYDMRVVHRMVPQAWDGRESDSLTQLWLRDDPPRALDFPALAALCDAFYPRVWLRRATRVPAGTVSITTYFHASSAALAEVGDGYLFAQARGQAFRNGFFDQSAQLWNEAGHLLATSHQVVYYKE